MHGLIANATLTTGKALKIVNAAIEVQADYVAQADGTGRHMQWSQTLLCAIAASLETVISAPATEPPKSALADIDDPSFEGLRYAAIEYNDSDKTD